MKIMKRKRWMDGRDRREGEDGMDGRVGVDGMDGRVGVDGMGGRVGAPWAVPRGACAGSVVSATKTLALPGTT